MSAPDAREQEGAAPFAYRLTDAPPQRVEVSEALSEPADLIWAHFPTVADETCQWLRSQAELPDHVVDALTAMETRPRCDAWDQGAFLNLRGRSDEKLPGTDPLASVRIWAIKGHVYSVTRTQLVAVDLVEEEVRQNRVRDPGDLIAAFATAITGDLDPRVADLGDELDACEERLDQAGVFELRRTVARARSTAIGYRRFLQPQRAALEKLATLPGDWLGDDDRQHLNAAADRAARMAEEVEAIRERASLIHETLTDLRAEQLDQRGLLLSIVALIFLPLTFITGLYGMNVPDLPGAQSPHAFDWISVACVLISLVILGFFLRRHWFTR